MPHYKFDRRFIKNKNFFGTELPSTNLLQWVHSFLAGCTFLLGATEHGGKFAGSPCLQIRKLHEIELQTEIDTKIELDGKGLISNYQSIFVGS